MCCTLTSVFLPTRTGWYIRRSCQYISVAFFVNQSTDVNGAFRFRLRRRMRKIRKSYRCCKITDSDNKLSLLYQHQRNITWNMISSHVKRSPLLWLHNKSHLSQQKLLIVKPCIWWKNCAPGDKSTKFGMIMVLGLLNNISYAPQSWGGGRDLYLGGVGLLQFPLKLPKRKR